MYLFRKVLSWFGYVLLDGCSEWKDPDGQPCEYGYKYYKAVKERDLYKSMYTNSKSIVEVKTHQLALHKKAIAKLVEISGIEHPALNRLINE